MKVKELIEKLQKCDQEKEVAYECQYVDYVHEHPNLVDTGGLRPLSMSRWIPLAKMEPEDGELYIVAYKDCQGKWSYYDQYRLPFGLGTAAKYGALWLPIPRVPEDIYKCMGYDDQTIEKILNKK